MRRALIGNASDAVRPGPQPLKRTCLYDMHAAAGAKFGPFAGWDMPLQYQGHSVMASTKHTREKASLFDVSHMCPIRLAGADCVAFLETLVVGDIKGLAPGTSTLTVLTNERGGIIDDSVVTKYTEDELYVVLNAGCRDKDLPHIEKHLSAFQAKGGDCLLHVYDERGLVALQGPKAQDALQPLTPGHDLSKLYFGMFIKTQVNGTECFITRTGYTGEDGFEVSPLVKDTPALCEALLATGGGETVKWAGLAVRDATRLEAGLCLYGNDLDEDTTPVEAGLTWTVGKARRADGGFLGAETILGQINKEVPVTKRRVGLSGLKAPARDHCDILSADGTKVGEVTSGTYSPSLGKPIAMGYVKPGFNKAGTELQVVVRGKAGPAVATKMPFVPAKYHRPE